jgi:imidazolonepropionase-like amidohydrolase
MSHAGDFPFQQLNGDTLNVHDAWKQIYSKSFRFDSTALVKLLQAMQQRGVFLDPTIFHASNNKMYNAFTVTRMAHRLGVKIVTGTDWIYPEKNEPVPLMEEMLLLVSKCGLTIPEVIQCATLNSATVTGLHDRGQIREGTLADLIITKTNPYISIPALFQPEMVMKKGQVLQW